MDYIYGELNSNVEKIEYNGLSSDTAEVIIDNVKDTIKVNVTGVSKNSIISIESLRPQPPQQSNTEWFLKASINDNLKTTYTWVRGSEINQNIQEQLDSLNNQILKLNNDLIDERSARELLQQQLEVESNIRDNQIKLESQLREEADKELNNKIDSLLNVSGTINIKAIDWDMSTKTQIITLNELTPDDAILFTPETQQDVENINYYGLSANVDEDLNYKSIIFSATIVPTSDINLNFFIIRGGSSSLNYSAILL